MTELLLVELPVEPSVEHWQLVLSPCLVAAAQELLVLWRDPGVSGDGVSEVLNEQVLAEGSVAIVQAAVVLDLEVESIYSLCEVSLVAVNEQRTSCWLELLEAEGIEHNLESLSHDHLILGVINNNNDSEESLLINRFDLNSFIR